MQKSWLIIILALNACSPSRPALVDSLPILAACPAPTADNFYFANGLLDPKSARGDTFVRDWYSRQLAAMGEPSLGCGASQAGEAYRFLWLRTFHHPIAVRVARLGKTWTLHAVELDGAGGYEPGKPLHTSDRQLSADEIAKLTAAISNSRFWATPTVEPPTSCSSAASGNDCIVMQADGAQWIFEGRTTSYHAVDRWDARQTPIGALGIAFLDIARIKVPAEELY